jgi:hypothetical protein
VQQQQRHSTSPDTSGGSSSFQQRHLLCTVSKQQQEEVCLVSLQRLSSPLHREQQWRIFFISSNSFLSFARAAL